MSADRGEVVGTLAAAWKRQLVIHANSNGFDLFAVYADEALTGWVGLTLSPDIGDFRGNNCLMVPIATWLHLKTHAIETVTPFRIVAKGNGLIVAAWNGITGLKYAVRNTEKGACVFIPLTEFRPVA
jgi:hypothetical protein